MIEPASLLTIGLAFVVVVASPGPANLAAASVAVLHGRRIGLVFAFGLSVGLWFWGVLAAIGLGAVLQSSVAALFLLKLFGAAYLLWLAYQAGRTAVYPDGAKTTKIASGRWFLRGVVLNLSNPKAVFAWMAALSVGMDSQDGPAAVAIATVFCMLIGWVNATGWVLLFSQSGMMLAYRRVRRWIDGATAALFALAGFGMLRSALAK